ncbi:hypothetical protein [Flammeovirga sp. OC4]|uniref:hypothetical protein n=1 Tax=Flammeovirga sp. OC4 TaxID=1382345 RepID=UPI0005C5B7D5|nr:hypothetical protein [Flammeovirga sp. OC4]
MKLVFIFSIDEGKQDQLYALLHKVGAAVFSESKVKGIYTDLSETPAFFSQKNITTDSKLDIVAVTDEQANQILDAITTLNQSKAEFPIHAYTVDVEKMA